MPLLLEYWKPVVGYEHLYAVSNTGRVESIKRRKPMRTYKNCGYERVCLNSRNQQKHHLVHALVAFAFIGPRPLGLTINHRNGRKGLNWASNLEYLTNLENSQHAVMLGLSNRGSRHGKAKLNERKVLEIRAKAAEVSQDLMAVQYGCSPTTISRVISRQMWKHV